MSSSDIEEEFRSRGGQWDEAQLIDDQQTEAGQIPLQVEQPSLIPGLQRSALPRFHRRGPPAKEAAWAYWGDMTTWSVAGGTSPRAALSM